MDSNEMLTLLRQYTCLKTEEAEPDRESTRSALLWAVENSDIQILGICADNSAQGQTALQNYLSAFASQFMPEVPSIEADGPLYIKFNPKTRNCTAEGYSGDYRGVLVSCQSEYEGDVNEMFGHLPLDLFGLD
jgi:hypothetical protein